MSCLGKSLHNTLSQEHILHFTLEPHLLLARLPQHGAAAVVPRGSAARHPLRRVPAQPPQLPQLQRAHNPQRRRAPRPRAAVGARRHPQPRHPAGGGAALQRLHARRQLQLQPAAGRGGGGGVGRRPGHRGAHLPPPHQRALRLQQHHGDINPLNTTHNTYLMSPLS